ncbi:alpha/beta hydrolase [Polymorphospora rubra]|uniref:alpha/beta fold hydrolase n=1 Tax=Polymorphospora rubra TaxID=338584 RepID=UPI0033E136B6
MQSLHLADAGGALRYHDLPGSGPAGVYIPGLACAATADFPETAAHPAIRDRRWILVDPFGVGFSDRPADFPYTIEAHAATVAALLDHLGLAGCAVVGSSMGGAVAITLATARPDLVGHLLLAEPALDRGRGMLSPYLADLDEAEFVGRGHRELVEMLEKAAADGHTGAGNFAAAVRAAAPYAMHRSGRSLRQPRDPSFRDQLYRLPMGRAVVVGARTGVDLSTFAAHGIPTYEVPAAGHSMMDENPAGFATALAAGLAGWR